MEIEKTITENRMDVRIEGKLDAVSSPTFEMEVTDELSGITELSIDLENVEYISSAGLRVLLYLQQVMNEQGSMEIRNVPEAVYSVFELTGFTEIVKIV